jgi:tRNA pseudouridine38-40 synthase
MQRYFIQLCYKGSRYHGWQIQRNAHSVQAELEQAMKTVFGEEIEITGCGRTDTGVHARDFFAHFDSEQTNLDHPDRKFKLNKFLPKDIAIKKIFKVKADAHARFDAISRKYRYYISKTKNPFLYESSYYLYGTVDLERMKKASEVLFNYQNFGCFSKSKTQVKTNICKIMQADWEEQEDMIIFTIKADRFLRNMVRAIVGTLLDVGKKKISIDEFKMIIEGENRCKAGASVPACGLFLENVEYPEEILE